jgi:hypothetical protein
MTKIDFKFVSNKKILIYELTVILGLCKTSEPHGGLV